MKISDILKENKEQVLYLVRGISGSGKSTYAHKLKEQGLVDSVLEAGQYFVDSKGNYNFEPSKIKQAHSYCQSKTKELLSKGRSVAVANTFTKKWEMDFYVKLAESLGITLKIIRLETRYKNIHNVPEEVVKDMEERFEDYPSEQIVK